MRFLRLKHRGDDEGAVAVVTALVVSMLLLPLLWLVVDGGGMFTERRQLQNAADAGALAAAQECSKQLLPSNCMTSLLFTPAAQLVDDNDGFDSQADRNDGVTFNNEPWYFCGNVGDLPTCVIPPVVSKYDCPAAPPVDGAGNAVAYVQVRVVSGGEGWKGYISDTKTQVFACSRAGVDTPHIISTWYPGTPASSYIVPIPGTSPSPSSWVVTYPPVIETNPGVGSPGRANTLGFTMPKCIWDNKTNKGKVYGPSTTIKYDVNKVDVLVRNTPGCDPKTVNSSANGSLLGAKALCAPTAIPPVVTNCGGTATGVIIGQTFPQDQGNWSSFQGLETLLAANPDQTWIMPVYDTVTGTGNNLYYHIVAFVGFHITSFNLQGQGAFFNGYFTTALCTIQSECGGSSSENTGVGNSTFTTHPGPAPSTYTTMYPGQPPSSTMVVIPPVPGYSSSGPVPGDPASAKPVF